MFTILLHFYGSVSSKRRYTVKSNKSENTKEKNGYSNDIEKVENIRMFRMFVSMFIIGVKSYSFVCAHISSIFALEKFKWFSNGVLTSSLSLCERKADLLFCFWTFVSSFCAVVCGVCFGNLESIQIVVLPQPQCSIENYMSVHFFLLLLCTDIYSDWPRSSAAFKHEKSWFSLLTCSLQHCMWPDP